MTATTTMAHLDHEGAVRDLGLTTTAAVAVASLALWLQSGILGEPVVAPAVGWLGVGVLAGAGWFVVLGRPPRHWTVRRLSASGRALTTVVIVLRATAEEIVWRGTLLVLAERYGLPVVWLAATSLLFGYTHAHHEHRWPTVATGAMLGVLALAAGDIVTACIAHTIFNVAVFEISSGAQDDGGRRLVAPVLAPSPVAAPTGPEGLRGSQPGRAGVTAGSGAPAVEWDAVAKKLGRSQALSDFSLAVGRGQITVVLGPNGAGKTTALSLVVGLRRPDDGVVRVLGGDPWSRRTRLAIGTAPQDVSFPFTIRVGELVDFARAHHVDPYPAADILGWCGLDALERRQAGGLSGGERRRLALALAIAGRPELLVLDEPTNGLDIEARAAMWQRLDALRDEGRTVLLTTHDLTEAERLADVVAVVDRGRVVAVDSPAALRRALGRATVRFEATQADAELVSRWDDAVTIRAGEHGLVELTAVTSDADSLVRRLFVERVDFARLRVEEAPLEDAIRAMSGGRPGPPPTGTVGDGS